MVAAPVVKKMTLGSGFSLCRQLFEFVDVGFTVNRTVLSSAGHHMLAQHFDWLSVAQPNTANLASLYGWLDYHFSSGFY